LPQFDPAELAALKPLTTIKNITLEHGESEQKREKECRDMCALGEKRTFCNITKGRKVKYIQVQTSFK